MNNVKPSKSARKREHLALQELGEKLIALSDAELDSVPLNDELRRAVGDATRMKSRGALRRQKQLIGKLMRRTDTEPIRAALHRLGAGERRARQLFSAAERWRDRLINDGATAVDEFVVETGQRDAELQRLIAALHTTPDERTEKTLRRRIFRRIHALLVAAFEERV